MAPAVASASASASTPAPVAPSTATARPIPPPETPFAPHTIRTEVRLGARFATGASDAVEPRFAFGASYWPRAMHERLGVGATAGGGYGVAISRPSFSGRYLDYALAFSARGRQPFTGWLAGEVSAGGALHFVSIDGERLGGGGHTSAQRLDPSLDAGLLLDVLIGSRLSVGVFVDATLMLRYQRYVINGSPMLDPPPVGGVAGARLSIALD